MEILATGGRRWFVLASEPRAEFKARESLVGEGIEAYVPIVRGTHRRAYGRMREGLKPLFPGYLFAADPGGGARGAIVGARGVRTVLTRNERWLALGDREVMAIFQQETAERFGAPPPRQAELLKPTDMVRIVDGQFAGFTGRFDRLAPKGRIIVLLELLGRAVEVNFDERQVAAA